METQEAGLQGRAFLWEDLSKLPFVLPVDVEECVVDDAAVVVDDDDVDDYYEQIATKTVVFRRAKYNNMMMARLGYAE